MRNLLLAGAAVLLAMPAFAQVDFSTANGTSAAKEASTSNVIGLGSNMSGGMIDSLSQATDISASMTAPGLKQTATQGSAETTITGMTFDVGTGSNTGTASQSGTAAAAFKGFSLIGHHH
jgi:hypothetical protein